jgi:hypothetical protein
MKDLGIGLILLLLTCVLIWTFHYFIVPKIDVYTQDFKNFFIFKAIIKREKREQEIFDYLMRKPIKVADCENDDYDFEEEDEVDVVETNEAYLQKKVDRTTALLDIVNNLNIESIENHFKPVLVKKKSSLWNDLIKSIKDSPSYDYYFATNSSIIPPIGDEINDFDIENQISTNAIKEKSFRTKKRSKRREVGRDSSLPRVKYKNSTEFYEHQQHFKNLKEQAEMEERIKEHFIYNSSKNRIKRGKRNWKKRVLEDNDKKCGWSLTYKQFTGIPKLIMEQLYGSDRYQNLFIYINILHLNIIISNYLFFIIIFNIFFL